MQHCCICLLTRSLFICKGWWMWLRVLWNFSLSHVDVWRKLLKVSYIFQWNWHVIRINLKIYASFICWNSLIKSPIPSSKCLYSLKKMRARRFSFENRLGSTESIGPSVSRIGINFGFRSSNVWTCSTFEKQSAVSTGIKTILMYDSLISRDNLERKIFVKIQI